MIKHLAYWCCLGGVLLGCRSTPAYQQLTGKTMGTTYMVKANSLNVIEQSTIDSILIAINQSLSTYIPTSIISTFNSSAHGIDLASLDQHFKINFGKSIQVSDLSQGAFDPTIMPLVNYWGFGTTGKKTLTSVDSISILELLPAVGFSKIQQTSDSITKSNPDVELDFSAIAKGYGVDVLCDYLDNISVTNYYVEIGGELRTKGVNDRGTAWTLGVNLPQRNASFTDVITYMQLSDRAMATSGNYRNYYEIEGEYYGHTIDPKTGFPVSDILSATIIADDCMTADAMATACMVMGVERSLDMIESSNNVEGLFVYSIGDGDMAIKQTNGISKYRLDE